MTIPPGTRVLVTGATGFIGSALVRKLHAQGAVVVGLARSSSNLTPLRDLPIQWVRGDICDGRAVTQAVQGAAYIVHLAGSFRDGGASAQTHHQVHVLGTQHIAEAAAGSPALRRFVHVSTIGVHGHIDSPPADEMTRFNPGDAYQRTKADAERWLTSFARKAQMPFSVIRPASVYGPGDRRLFRMFKMAAAGWVPIVGRSQGLLHLIHIDDLTDCLITAAVHPKAQGEAFICGNPAPTTFQRVVSVIGDQYGVPVRFIRLPKTPLLWLAGVCETVCPPLGMQPPLFKRRVEFFTKDRAFNTTKLTRVMHFTARISDEAGLRATAQWYVEHGWIALRPRKVTGTPLPIAGESR